jgi:predicted RNase H-like HicB family nuclease
MQTLRLYLEAIDGDWFGWMETFPGAYSQGATPEEATQAAPDALGDYLRWLRAHDEPLPAHLQGLTRLDFRVEVVATYQPRRIASGLEINGFFAPDERPLDEEDLERYFRLLSHARADMRKALRALPPEAFHTAPFGAKPVCDILRHVAEKELFSLSCLRLKPEIPASDDCIGLLEAARREFERAIRAMPEHKRGEVFTAQGERWSLRKALRRALWHERYHAAQIEARSNPVAFLRSLAVVDARQREHNVHAW